MAYLREGLDAYVREHFDTRLNSTFVQRNPLLYMLGLRSVEGKTKLGQPKAGAIFGGVNLGESKRKEMLGSKEVFYSYVKSEPNDGGYVDYGGATRTASTFVEDNKGQLAYRWVDYQEPMKVRQHSLLFAKGESAIGSILDDGMAQTWTRMQKRINTLLWSGGTAANGSSVNMNTEAEQAREVWREPLGLRYVVGTQNNILGRVNRTSETILNPFQIASATAFSSTVIDLDVNRKVNNGYVDATSSDVVDGIANKNDNGIGCNLFILPPILFNEVASQADARGINVRKGVEGHSVTGFEGSVIEHDGVHYIWDKDCPSGTMYCLDLDQIVVEVSPTANFTWGGFNDKTKEEGGEKYDWGNYDAMLRLGYLKPWLMGTVTGLTAI
ncbi:MAG: hypothetical protein Q8P61_05950 [Candidatus Nanopelagicales bacterium]|nr:hypothetical protein [Candidatus Nanopelagicales bacterium]